MHNHQASLERELNALFERNQQAAEPLFAPEALLDLTALVILSLPPEQRLDSDASWRILRAFAQRVGLRADLTAAEVNASITEHFRKNPTPVALSGALGAILRDVLTGAALDLGAKVQHVLGSEPASFTAPQPPKDGQVRAGPLARFSVPSIKR